MSGKERARNNLHNLLTKSALAQTFPSECFLCYEKSVQPPIGAFLVY
jgi:hypothetical protein